MEVGCREFRAIQPVVSYGENHYAGGGTVEVSRPEHGRTELIECRDLTLRTYVAPCQLPREQEASSLVKDLYQGDWRRFYIEQYVHHICAAPG